MAAKKAAVSPQQASLSCFLGKAGRLKRVRSHATFGLRDFPWRGIRSSLRRNVGEPVPLF